mgnify:CR=1 FL=1
MTKPFLSDYGTYDESTVPRLWDGVVGAWCPSLGPTGGRLHDFSKNNNWGTLTNMDPATDWVVNGDQYSLDFDGVNDVVTMTPGIVTGTQAFTMSAWARLNSNPTFYRGVFMMGGGATGNSAWIGWATTTQNGALYSWGGGGFGRNYGSGVTDYSGWHHLVLTSSGGSTQTFNIYVDGGNNVTGSETITLTSSHLRIGSNPTDAPTDGNIDDIKLWNRALAVNEVRELYLLGRGGMFQRRRVRRFYVSQAVNRRRRLICGAEC